MALRERFLEFDLEAVGDRLRVLGGDGEAPAHQGRTSSCSRYHSTVRCSPVRRLTAGAQPVSARSLVESRYWSRISPAGSPGPYSGATSPPPTSAARSTTSRTECGWCRRPL